MKSTRAHTQVPFSLTHPTSSSNDRRVTTSMQHPSSFHGCAQLMCIYVRARTGACTNTDMRARTCLQPTSTCLQAPPHYSASPRTVCLRLAVAAAQPHVRLREPPPCIAPAQDARVLAHVAAVAAAVGASRDA